ncbi:hypothetical protein [Solirubrobacter soli]|uniref:hypothetical protein n=1 Tax=Solirubrobacter soli TaxID=363832 RepID=UPI000410E3AA|nr:hypothetical protein [Solirubrobacter soli]
MFKRLARRPSPALIVAIAALFAGTAGVTYAATQGPPSFTARGVAFVPGSAFNNTALPISGANTSGISNHGMTIASPTNVAVPTSGNYLLTLNGNCNGGAANTRFQIREGASLAGALDLDVGGAAGNPSLSGANTVHLAAGTRLGMVVHQTGSGVNCGATLGVNLVSADA